MKKIKSLLTAATVAALAVGAGVSAYAESWTGYRGNEDNNAVVSASLPDSADNAALYWATKIGTSWTDTPSSVTLVNDKIVFTAADRIYSMDKESGVADEKSTQMISSSSWSMIAPCYAEGLIFVGLSNGTVQCFDADTLESLWVYKDTLGGQPNSPFTYSEGKVYTGFWNSETMQANFVCIDVTDEDKTSGTEEKTADWTYTQNGGFYWAGACAKENFITVATDDGASSSSESAKVLTFNKTTGAVIDELDNIYGDIRSSMVYDKVTDRYYFTSKGGLFCSVKISDKGKISDYKEIILNGKEDRFTNPVATTSSPVVLNGRAYIGVSGSNAYGKYTGSGIMVIDLDSFSVAYKAQTMGYPQVSGLGCTGDDGYNYVYFVENTSPSEIRYVKDKAGVTEILDATTETYKDVNYTCAPVLWTPTGAQSNYAISNLICDNNGTIYFKNDSAYIMAVGSTVDSLEVTGARTLYKAGESFDSTEMKITAKYSNGVESDITNMVQISSEPLTEDDTFVTVTYDYGMYKDSTNSGGANSTGVDVAQKWATVDVNVLDENSYNQVDNAIGLINSIGEVTKDSADVISQARTAYDALDESLKEYVKNLSVLEQAEQTYKNLLNESLSSSETSSEENQSGSSVSDSSSQSSADSSETDTSSSADSSKASSGSTTSSKADSSSKTSQQTNSNPSTGFAKSAAVVFAVMTAGGIVALRRKNK